MKTRIQNVFYGTISVIFGMFFGILILFLTFIGLDNWYEIKKQWRCFEKWLFNK